MKIILFTLLLLAPALHSVSQPKNDRYLSRAEVLKDLDVIRTSVTEILPGLNRFQQQKAFNAAGDSIRQILEKTDSIAPIDFFRTVNPLITKIKCGHIKFFPPMENFPFYYNSDNLFPAIVRFDNLGRLVVVASSDQTLKGKVIDRVNGDSVTDILKVLRTNIFVDGDSKTSADAQIEQYFSAWYGDFVQNAAQFKLLVSDLNGAQQEVKVTGISLASWKSLNASFQINSSKNELTFKNDSVAVLRVANFMLSQKEFKAFLKQSFTQIQQKPVSKLIIDVRGNEGGNDALGKDLYSYISRSDFRYYDRIEVNIKGKKDVTYQEYTHFPRFSGLARLFIKKQNGKLLWKKHQNLGDHHPEKIAYKGEVVFLADGLSFSVTSEFLSVAKSNARGQFIGTESGGTYEGNNSGGFLIFNLPGSHFDLGIPLATYYSAVKSAAQPARGVMPDRTILSTTEDLIHGRDTVLNAVLQPKSNSLTVR